MFRDILFFASVALGVIGAIVTILVFAVPDLRDKLARILRSKYDWVDVSRNIRTAKHRVWILQTWFPGLKLERKFWEQALKGAEVDFRVLVLDAACVPNRLICRKDVATSSLSENLAIFRVIHEKYAKDFKVRSYTSLPFGPIYIIDNDVYWGLYLPQRDSLDLPANRATAHSEFGHLLVEGYECVWTKFEANNLLAG